MKQEYRRCHRLLVLSLCLCMVLSLFPTTALAIAAEPELDITQEVINTTEVENEANQSTLNGNSSSPVANQVDVLELDITKGDIDITEEGVVLGKNSSEEELNDNSAHSYHIVGNGEKTENHIRLSGSLDVTLEGVNIDASQRMAMVEGIVGGANTYALLVDDGGTVTINLKGENTVVGGGRYAGVTVHDDATVTINCATHKQGDCKNCTDSLHAQGSWGFKSPGDKSGGATFGQDMDYGAPGIGGVSYQPSGYPEPYPLSSFENVNGATSGGTINICGGNIIAQSSDLTDSERRGYGAAIGSGATADRTNPINISGGYVQALNNSTRGYGAGIGGGATADAGVIKISENASVIANGGSNSAGIGGGGGHVGIANEWNGSVRGSGGGGNITITGASSVLAYGGVTDGAGIGGGGNEIEKNGAAISIAKTADVEAYSAGNLPAVHSEDGEDNLVETAADMLNHRIEVPLNSKKETEAQLFYQSTQVPTGDPEQDTANYTVTVPKGYKNFAILVDSQGFYTEKVSVPDIKAEYSQMGHVENVDDIFFKAGTSRDHVDVVYSIPAIYVEDVTIHFGEDVILSAEDFSIPEDDPIETYSWENRDPDPTWGLKWYEIDNEDSSELNITLPNVEYGNLEYRCTAILKSGKKVVGNVAQLTVLPTTMLITVDDMYIKQGGNVEPPSKKYDRFVGEEINIANAPHNANPPNNDPACHTIYIMNDRHSTKTQLYKMNVEFQHENGQKITDTSTLDPGVYNIVINNDQDATNITRQNYIFTVINGKLIVNASDTDAKTMATIIKEDSADSRIRLENAKFELYKDNARYDNNTYATDEEGRIILIDKLEYGSYYWKEIAAPDGYNFIADEEFHFTLSKEDPHSVITVTNSSHYIVGFNSQGGSAVPSQQIDPTGALLVKEPKQPTYDGYSFDGWYTKDAGGVKWDFANNKISGNMILYAHWTKNTGGGGSSSYTMTLSKTNESSKYLSDATFELYRESGKKIGSYTTNSKGQITIQNLSNGNYYFIETSAPDGYALDDSKHEFTISGKNRTLTIVNYALIPSDLNGADHMRYIVGYPDGTVQPNAAIIRSEVATMFYRLLNEDRRDDIFTTHNTFNDITTNMWYNKAVSSMAAGGYIFGYPDGSFGGNRPITRAELVAIAARFMNAKQADLSFSDVDANHWAYKDISSAVAYGWIVGYPDGTFKPDQLITRAEAMAIINRMLNRGVEEDGILDNFKVWPDNQSDTWYYYEIIEATNHHEHTGKRPSETWTSLTIDYFYDIDKYETP